MFSPKWGILAVALAVFALAAGYDAQLGLAVGVSLLVLVSIGLWIRVRFAMQPGTSNADRARFTKRFRKLGRNRRVAQAEAELSAKMRRKPGKRA